MIRKPWILRCKSYLVVVELTRIRVGQYISIINTVTFSKYRNTVLTNTIYLYRLYYFLRFVYFKSVWLQRFRSFPNCFYTTIVISWEYHDILFRDSKIRIPPTVHLLVRSLTCIRVVELHHTHGIYRETIGGGGLYMTSRFVTYKFSWLADEWCMYPYTGCVKRGLAVVPKRKHVHVHVSSI